jgi:pimeloyl-ACP methyl ester carboxylesterase
MDVSSHGMDMIGRAHMTEVGGTTIAWGEMGDGPPLILLHGIQDSHRAWRRVAPLLAERFRVLMPDLPGSGLSGRPDAPYTLTWFAEMIGAWMEAIGVEHAHFCAHSFGGGIAQWMLLKQRARVDRLALVAPGGLGRGVAPGMRISTFPVLGPLLTPKLMSIALPAAVRLAPGLFGHMEPEEQERFIALSRIPGSDRAFRRTVGGVINVLGQYVASIDRVGEVAQLPPMALFWGDKDPVIPVRHGRKTVARSEGITLTVYKGCGHFVSLDEPARFAADLMQFLSDPDRMGARIRPSGRRKAR